MGRGTAIKQAPQQANIPPRVVQLNAELGLALRKYAQVELGRSRPGGTDVGVAMAKRIASGKPLDLKTIKKISQYFPRHEVDRRHKDWGNEERPSPGYVAWCVPGDTEIHMASGEQRRIDNIVRNEVTDDVLSWDGTRLVSSPIVNWFEQDSRLHDFVRVGRDHRQRLPLCTRKSTHLDLTEEHPMLTPDGWVSAESMLGKEHALVEVGLDSIGEQVALGSVIGDGYLEYAAQGARLRLTHGNPQEEWLIEKVRLLSPIMIGSVRNAVSLSGYGKGNTMVFSNSRVSQGLTSLCRGFCLHDERRTVTREFLSRLRDVGVATWIADDGSLHTDKREGKHSYRIHTEGFSLESAQILLEWIREYTRSGDITLVQRENTNGHCLNLGRQASFNLASKIVRYTHPSMRYKVHPELRDAEYVLGSHTPETIHSVVWRETTKVQQCSDIAQLERHKKKLYAKKYNITVLGTNNFVANGFVVHNCLWGGDEGRDWSKRYAATHESTKR